MLSTGSRPWRWASLPSCQSLGWTAVRGSWKGVRRAGQRLKFRWNNLVKVLVTRIRVNEFVLHKDLLFNLLGQILIPGCKWSWAFGFLETYRTTEVYSPTSNLYLLHKATCFDLWPLPSKHSLSIHWTRQFFILHLKIQSFLEAKWFAQCCLSRDKGKTLNTVPYYVSKNIKMSCKHGRSPL